MHSFLRPISIMKRPRTAKTNPPPPSTPPPSQIRHSNSKTTISQPAKKPKSLLLPPKTPPQPVPLKWVPLNLTQSELYLHLTFPTGQTFRWKQTGPLQYTGVIDSHLISLKHLQNGDVSYCIHSSCTTAEADSARLALLGFLNASISLTDVWDVFSASDSRFEDLSRYLGGARVLRQDPLECLIQFLCSSNNNIGRITKMVGYISSLGNYLGNVGDFEFYQFPSLKRLSLVSEQELRDAGFGYRAKYIIGTVNTLESKPGGGLEWLLSLRKHELPLVIEALSSLPGVGPKVAACIALFSLDQHHAIPVDTHVWQIATRYLVPELAGSKLTPKMYKVVEEAFVSRYGKYAGWAQTLLFVAELPSQKALLQSHLKSIDNEKLPK